MFNAYLFKLLTSKSSVTNHLNLKQKVKTYIQYLVYKKILRFILKYISLIENIMKLCSVLSRLNPLCERACVNISFFFFVNCQRNDNKQIFRWIVIYYFFSSSSLNGAKVIILFVRLYSQFSFEWFCFRDDKRMNSLNYAHRHIF